MSMSDPIADLLTRIRNAIQARHASVVVPRSKLKLEVVKIFLKYDGGKQGVIQGLKRVSSPSRRFYVGKDEIPRVRNGLGLAILTTPQGVLSDRAARSAGVGGEVLCYVW